MRSLRSIMRQWSHRYMGVSACPWSPRLPPQVASRSAVARLTMIKRAYVPLFTGLSGVRKLRRTVKNFLSVFAVRGNERGHRFDTPSINAEANNLHEKLPRCANFALRFSHGHSRSRLHCMRHICPRHFANIRYMKGSCLSPC